MKKKNNMKLLVKLLVSIVVLNLVCFGVTPLQITNYISNIDCSRIIIKDAYTICYDDNLKAPLVDTYVVRGDKLGVGIEKRPSFYAEQSIPKEFRNEDYQYIKSGFDRGHLANDSSFDYDGKILEQTYNLINVIPQYPRVNRRTWRLIENYERDLAKLYGNITVINVINYGNTKVNNLSIPTIMNKIIIHNEYIECYSVNNDNSKEYNSHPLEFYKTECEFVLH